MREPELVPRAALTARRIAISVADSPDLARLGLTPAHCELAVAELGRAIMLAGGTVVYGGRIGFGFTNTLVDEAQRFGEGRVLEIVQAESEYRQVSRATYRELDRTLSEVGLITLVSAKGTTIDLDDSSVGTGSVDARQALTAMRTYMATTTDARVVLGGTMSSYSGIAPGIIEEARLTLDANGTLLAAAGFGGAAAAVARVLHRELVDSWAPPNFPEGVNHPEIVAALETLAQLAAKVRPDAHLDSALVHTLTVSHRPGDIASAAVRLLS